MFRVFTAIAVVQLVHQQHLLVLGGGGSSADTSDDTGVESILNDVDVTTGNDMLILMLIVAALALLSMGWEITNEYLDHILTKKHQTHLLALREKFFKEMAIVGLLSMALFILVTSGSLDKHTQHIFEFAHLTIIVIILLYLVLILFLAILSVRIIKTWDKLEEMDKDEIAEVHDELTLKRKEYGWFRFFVLNPSLARTYQRHQGSYEYHVLREYFIEHYNLPSGFKFSKYLKRCVKAVFAQVVELHWSVAALVLFFQALLWVPFSVLDWYTGIPFFIYSFLLFFVSYVVMRKVKNILHQIGAKPSEVMQRPKALGSEGQDRKTVTHYEELVEPENVEQTINGKNGDSNGNGDHVHEKEVVEVVPYKNHSPPKKKLRQRKKEEVLQKKQEVKNKKSGYSSDSEEENSSGDDADEEDFNINTEESVFSSSDAVKNSKSSRNGPQVPIRVSRNRSNKRYKKKRSDVVRRNTVQAADGEDDDVDFFGPDGLSPDSPDYDVAKSQRRFQAQKKAGRKSRKIQTTGTTKQRVGPSEKISKKSTKLKPSRKSGISSKPDHYIADGDDENPVQRRSSDDRPLRATIGFNEDVVIIPYKALSELEFKGPRNQEDEGCVTPPPSPVFRVKLGRKKLGKKKTVGRKKTGKKTVGKKVIAPKKVTPPTVVSDDSVEIIPKKDEVDEEPVLKRPKAQKATNVKDPSLAPAFALMGSSSGGSSMKRYVSEPTDLRRLEEQGMSMHQLVVDSVKRPSPKPAMSYNAITENANETSPADMYGQLGIDARQVDPDDLGLDESSSGLSFLQADLGIAGPLNPNTFRSQSESPSVGPPMTYEGTGVVPPARQRNRMTVSTEEAKHIMSPLDLVAQRQRHHEQHLLQHRHQSFSPDDRAHPKSHHYRPPGALDITLDNLQKRDGHWYITSMDYVVERPLSHNMDHHQHHHQNRRHGSRTPHHLRSHSREDAGSIKSSGSMKKSKSMEFSQVEPQPEVPKSSGSHRSKLFRPWMFRSHEGRMFRSHEMDQHEAEDMEPVGWHESINLDTISVAIDSPKNDTTPVKTKRKTETVKLRDSGAGMKPFPKSRSMEFDPVSYPPHEGQELLHDMNRCREETPIKFNRTASVNMAQLDRNSQLSAVEKRSMAHSTGHLPMRREWSSFQSQDIGSIAQELLDELSESDIYYSSDTASTDWTTESESIYSEEDYTTTSTFMEDTESGEDFITDGEITVGPDQMLVKIKERTKIKHIHHHHHHHHNVHHHHRLHHHHHHNQPEHQTPSWLLHFIIPLFKCDIRSIKNYFSHRKHTKSAHQDLFWFNSPRFLVYLIQVLLFAQAFYLILVIMVMAGELNEDNVTRAIESTFGLLLGMYILIFITPSIIYYFSIVVNVGEYTKLHILEEVKHKHHLIIGAKPRRSIGPAGDGEEMSDLNLKRVSLPAREKNPKVLTRLPSISAVSSVTGENEERPQSPNSEVSSLRHSTTSHRSRPSRSGASVPSDKPRRHMHYHYHHSHSMASPNKKRSKHASKLPE